MTTVQSNTNVTCFNVIILVSNSCLIMMRIKFYKDTNDCLSYIYNHAFHDYFSFNCLVEEETGTMPTDRASDTTLDKPLSEECRKILNGVKYYLVKDMDAEEVLLRMAHENVFNAAEEDRIKAKPTRSEKNGQLLEILPTKGTKAYEIFKKVLQKVHQHLANLILERGKCYDDHENQLALKESCMITCHPNFGTMPHNTPRWRCQTGF